MRADGVREIIDRIADGEEVAALLQSVEKSEREEIDYLMPALNRLAELRSIQPEEGLKEKIKAEIMERIAQNSASSRGKVLVPRFGFKLRPLAILAAMMMLGTGTAFASTSAMPDSVLYPVKKAIESVSKNIANGNSRAMQILTYNQRRIEEIKYLQANREEGGIGQLVKEINMNIKELKALSKDIGPKEGRELEESLTKFIDKNQKLMTKQENKALKKGSGTQSQNKEQKAGSEDADSSSATDIVEGEKTTGKPADTVKPETQKQKVSSGNSPAAKGIKPATPRKPATSVGSKKGK